MPNGGSSPRNKPPQDYDYGMRDFDVVGLDGNQIFFGMASNKTA